MRHLYKGLDSVFIAGCGDIGRRVARLWQIKDKGKAINGSVIGLVRSVESAAMLNAWHIQPVIADLENTQSISGQLKLAQSLLYYFAPPSRTGIDDLRMKNFLAEIEQNNLPAKFIYLSTSGVYGDQQGRLIDETVIPNPKEDRAIRRYAAECAVRDWGMMVNVPVVILRVGGIYGPGRLPVKRLLDRVPVIHENLAPSTNRIHADDLAQACVAAAIYGEAGGIYNITDGCHSNMTEYFNQIADFVGLPRPPAVDWNEAEKVISRGMLSYLRESRRLDNRRMLEELKVKLQYPDLQAGLQTCLAEKINNK